MAIAVPSMQYVPRDKRNITTLTQATRYKLDPPNHHPEPPPTTALVDSLKDITDGTQIGL